MLNPFRDGCARGCRHTTAYRARAGSATAEPAARPAPAAPAVVTGGGWTVRMPGDVAAALVLTTVALLASGMASDA